MPRLNDWLLVLSRNMPACPYTASCPFADFSKAPPARSLGLDTALSYSHILSPFFPSDSVAYHPSSRREDVEGGSRSAIFPTPRMTQ